MTMKLPITVVCSWCHAKKRLDDGRWVKLFDTPEPTTNISSGTCDECAQRWKDEEQAINDDIREG
jgi:hypothetical protein